MSRSTSAVRATLLTLILLVVGLGFVAILSASVREWLVEPLATDWINLILVAVLLIVTARYADTTDKLLAAQVAERRAPIQAVLDYIEEQLSEAEGELKGERYGPLVTDGHTNERWLDQFIGEEGELNPKQLHELIEDVRPRSVFLARTLKRLSLELSAANTHLHNFRNKNEGSGERLRTEIEDARRHLSEARKRLETF